MASGLHFIVLLCLTGGLWIGGNASATNKPDQQVSCCPSGWTQFGSRCFIFYHTTKPWIDAEHFCIAIGGNLASIHTTQENDFLSNLIQRVAGEVLPTWIGASDSEAEGQWLWSDGSDFVYKHWGTGQPDNWKGAENCAVINEPGFFWNDLDCSNYRPFVCGKNI